MSETSQPALPIGTRVFPARRRVALVHDYLVQDGGAERVLGVLQDMFPDAPTFVLIYDPERSHGRFKGRVIRTSFLDGWPLSHRAYQWYLPFMPMAVEHLDLSGFDLVISSSSSFAKGVIAAPESTHICYCHTPTRFLWQERLGYLNDLPQPAIMRMLLPPLLHNLRQWDRLAAERPDFLVTNSRTSQGRIKRYYGRETWVIHPPVDVSGISVATGPGSYWLCGGRLVGYKRFDLVVRAFAKLNLPLKIFGIGPEMKKLRAFAGAKTEFVGHVSDEEKAALYRDAIGFISPQIEDFGITVVEAMAAGRPVITYGQGGAKETVIPGVTGIHLETQSWEDIGDAVIRFDPTQFDPKTIRAHAEAFSTERFAEQMRAYIDHALAR
ncbi:glycosyltransferase [Candidatus Uhrbacteria bacterium]|nr:glycosyltransferase [Candidatus Uhrbacteria bacterium]